MKVYLTGYMGSGKSTVGRLLADQMKLSFIDFDRYIEGETGKTIAEIFDTLGEDRFRELEHRYLQKVLPQDNVVVSLGGGTPCFYNNIELINNSGISVFLEMEAEALVKRLSNAKNKRPLIRDLNETELRYFIEANLEKRIPFYKKAHFVINTDGLNADELAEKIKKLIAA